jgi:hypothetical protein
MWSQNWLLLGDPVVLTGNYCIFQVPVEAMTENDEMPSVHIGNYATVVSQTGTSVQEDQVNVYCVKFMYCYCCLIWAKFKYCNLFISCYTSVADHPIKTWHVRQHVEHYLGKLSRHSGKGSFKKMKENSRVIALSRAGFLHINAEFSSHY